MIGADGNEMDTEAFLASLHVVTTNAIQDCNGDTIIDAGGAVPFNLVAQTYGKGIVNYGDICEPDGCLLLQLDLTHPSVC